MAREYCLHVAEWPNRYGISAPEAVFHTTIVFVISEYATSYECTRQGSALILQNILKEVMDGFDGWVNAGTGERFVPTRQIVNQLIEHAETDYENYCAGLNQTDCEAWADIYREQDLNGGVALFGSKILCYTPYQYVISGELGSLQLIPQDRRSDPLNERALRSLPNMASSKIRESPRFEEIVSEPAGFEIYSIGKERLPHFAKHWHAQLTSSNSRMRREIIGTVIPRDSS